MKTEQVDTDDEYPGLRESDVLCVCGQTDLDYFGNIAFQKLRNMNKSIYESMSSSEDVRKLASSVAKLIEKNAVEDFLLANKKTMVLSRLLKRRNGRFSKTIKLHKL